MPLLCPCCALVVPHVDADPARLCGLLGPLGPLPLLPQPSPIRMSHNCGSQSTPQNPGNTGRSCRRPDPASRADQMARCSNSGVFWGCFFGLVCATRAHPAAGHGRQRRQVHREVPPGVDHQERGTVGSGVGSMPRRCACGVTTHVRRRTIRTRLTALASVFAMPLDSPV